MILVLIISSLVFIPLSLSDCPNNKTYGTNCTAVCTNCSLGCDVSGACINGLCLLGYYGTGCSQSNILISTAPVLVATNCTVLVTTSSYIPLTNNIGPSAYYVVYGPNTSTPSQNYSQWPSEALMTNYQASVKISGGSFMFGIYFTFQDLRYINLIQSLVSPVASATCNSSSNLPSTSTTTTSTTSTSSTTSVSTPSTVSTISTLYTGPTVTTLTTTTISTIKPIIPPTIPTTSSPLVTTTSILSFPSTSSPILTTTSILSIPSTSSPILTTTSILSNNSVQGLFCSSKTSSTISLRWSAPVSNVAVSYYTITVQATNYNGPILTTTALYQDISSLFAGSLFTIIVTTITASGQYPTSINVCTNPLPDIPINNVQVSNINRKSMNVAFPPDNTNYTCSTNIYRLGYSLPQSSSRRKRAASSISGIPSGATFLYNGTQLPSVLALSNLNSATNYAIYAEIYTNVNGTVTYYYSTTYQQTSGPSDGAIAGIVIGILLFLILLIILLVVLCLYQRRKQKSSKSKYFHSVLNPMKEVVNDTQPKSSAYWSPINDKMEPRHLTLNPNEWTDELCTTKNFAFTNQNYSPDGLKFIDEFSSLPEDSPYSHIAADANFAKNKKQDIFPYDHNRVKLQRKSVASSQTDYINASFIDGYLRKKAYIAAQSPFDAATSNDFWTMVYEQNVGQIIMLSETEFNYWPQFHPKFSSKENLYGTISVQIINEINYAFFDVREFEIKDVGYVGESQLVTQYQFHDWAHNEIPENGIAFLDFYQEIKVYAEISNGPLLVHCSTGISQSAVYIAFDILNQQVIHENCVNVFRTVAQLRRSRSKMVHNSKQYMFIYDLLFESILCGQFMINCNVRRIWKLLNKVNPQSGVEYLHEQFYLLQTYNMVTASPNQDTKDISFVNSVDRYQNLSTISSPMLNLEKVETFWNTIFDKKIDVIVDLKTTEDNPYYIVDNLTGIDIVTDEISTVNNQFRRFQLSIYHRNHEKRLNLSVYQLGTTWITDNDISREPDNNHCDVWVEIIYHLIMNHSHQNILAHCVNGWSKSGLFLTCFNVATKIFRSKYVMVYNVVKSMKFYRFEFVTSFAQFKFIFIFLKRFVDLKISNEDSGEEYLPGLLPTGDKLKESLFTHEQTPVLRPEQKQKFAPSLQTVGSREFNTSDVEERALVVHYNVGTSLDLVV